MKKSNQFTQSRNGAKQRKVEAHSLLCDLCVLCAFVSNRFVHPWVNSRLRNAGEESRPETLGGRGSSRHSE